MTAAYYLEPMLAQVALSFFIAALILATRLRDILSGNAPPSFYENYSGAGGPVMVQRTRNQLANAFEFPVLFFAVLSIAVASDVRDPLLLQLARAFVTFRWAHSVIHLTLNKLWIRMVAFMLSNLLLFGMWVRFALLVYSGDARLQ